jgi:LPS export ABC transporter protein LptC
MPSEADSVDRPNRLLAALAAVLLAASLSACSQRDAAPTEPVDEFAEAERPVQESWQPRMDVLEEDRPAFRLAAPYLARYDRGDSTFTRFGPAPSTSTGDTARVYLTLFRPDGERSASVVANEVVYHDEDGRFEAQGAVVVRADGAPGEEPRTLETEELRWNESDRRLLAPGFARLTTETEFIEGYVLEADEDLRNFTLQNITGRVRVEEE